MGTLRLAHRMEPAGHVVEIALEGMGPRRTAEARFAYDLTAQEREDLRWYLEDYLQYPMEPAPAIARRVEDRLAALGTELFKAVFEANRDTIRLWDAVAGSLAATRLEVAAGAEGTAGIPWELLRDPASDGVLALRMGAFVRTQPDSAGQPMIPRHVPDPLRILLVICRPGGQADVPFRSVASHLVRLSQGAREAFQLDVLRPPTFPELTRVLLAAKATGVPYHVVHFDGHGAYLNEEAVADLVVRDGIAEFDPAMFTLVSPPRPGAHGFLVFENRSQARRQVLVDGPALGNLLADAGVPVLVLNACRSAHADLVVEPETVAENPDAHQRVRAYGSLAQEVMDAGVAGIVAMRYNVYVVTAAQFIGEVYAGLLQGLELSAAVGIARRQLAANPLRQVGSEARPLQDWLVPVVYEAAPLALRPTTATSGLVVDLSQAAAGRERASLDSAMTGEPDVGFFGRDETLLALDRAFDRHPLVLLHAWAGAGKTSSALEFARWYALTGAANLVLFTSFEHHLTLTRLLNQIGDRFGSALAQAGMQWATLDQVARRDVAVQVLSQVAALWVWDNVEPVAGFPAGAPSAWTSAEQEELAGFLRQLMRTTRCKVLMTSRRDERDWLGDLPERVHLPPMPMLERLELARAIADRQPGGGQRFEEVGDWRPLLAFTQGNPLTITILVRQALHNHRNTGEQAEAFVTELRDGTAYVADDAIQGRSASLAASLDYGYVKAFTSAERVQLAILALFQGFVSIGTLCRMGSAEDGQQVVPALTALTQELGTRLLDRAAEIGLLTAYPGGHYRVHPAMPWYLQGLFHQHYGPPDGPAAITAIRAWTAAICHLGDYYHNLYGEGHREVIGFLVAEEANLLQARHLARQHGWRDLVIGPMQGLNTLYRHTGRALEWRRLVDELTPDFADPETGRPLPGCEDQSAILASYRVRIALLARDWPTAEKLQHAVIVHSREQTADSLSIPQDSLTGRQRNDLANLATSLGELGHILREEAQSSCTQPYLDAIRIYKRIGDNHGEGIISFNLGRAYEDIQDLRDLNHAQYWYQHASDLLEEGDTLGRAATTAQLGSIAYRRFCQAQELGESGKTLLRHLNDAAAAYHQALELLSPSAVDQLGVIYHQLGTIYGHAGYVSQAIEYLQKAIRYCEGQDDRYRAGLARHSAANILGSSGHTSDALLYCRAALSDFAAVGPGAAEETDLVRRLITLIQQEPPR